MVSIAFKTTICTKSKNMILAGLKEMQAFNLYVSMSVQECIKHTHPLARFSIP